VTWPAGQTKYISGVAEYQGDPNAYCDSADEAREKIKRRGMEVFEG
jgi:hypothetical protein